VSLNEVLGVTMSDGLDERFDLMFHIGSVGTEISVLILANFGLA